MAAIRADARVCAIVEQVPSYYEIKSVTLHGRAEVLADGQSRSDLLSSPAMDDPAGEGTPARAAAEGGLEP